MRRGAGTPPIQFILIAAVTGIIVYLLSLSQPFADIDLTKFFLIFLAILVCCGIWALARPYRLFQGRYRRRGVHPDTPHIDAMTKHLEHGDTPYLGDDGEVYFKKRSKHTKHAQHK